MKDAQQYLLNILSTAKIFFVLLEMTTRTISVSDSSTLIDQQAISDKDSIRSNGTAFRVEGALKLLYTMYELIFPSFI